MVYGEWKDPRHQLGWDAEVVAGEWFIARGFQVVAHRWRMGRNDLDLIVRRAELVAFVEVKVRRTDRFGVGGEAVGQRKRSIIERLAWSWILKSGQPGDQYRFDVIGLAGGGPGAEVTHYPDAWRPGWRR
jgi:putative endonuclease